MLRIALPNGNLGLQTSQLFERVGMGLTQTSRRYEVDLHDSRIARVVFMRPQHIPELVAQGSYDIGITGSDLVAEAGCAVNTISELNYNSKGPGDWRVVLFGTQDDPARSLCEIRQHSRILSEYPNVTKKALERTDVLPDVFYSRGSTEAHIPADYDYGVCVSVTNATIKANNLKIIDVLLRATTVLIVNPNTQKGPLRQTMDSFLRDLLP